MTVSTSDMETQPSSPAMSGRARWTSGGSSVRMSLSFMRIGKGSAGSCADGER